MHARRTAAASFLALATIASTALAGPPSEPGPTKPVAEQNLDADGLIRVHEQGIARVDVQNANLGVTVTNTPSVNVANTPSVHVDSLPDVTIANSTLDVNVVNGPLPVSGTVSIDNFPAQPAQAPLPTVTRIEHLQLVVPAGDSASINFPSMDAVMIGLNGLSNDFSATISGPLGYVFSVSSSFDSRLRTSYTYPVPVDTLHLICYKLVDDCWIGGEVFGF